MTVTGQSNKNKTKKESSGTAKANKRNYHEQKINDIKIKSTP